MDPDTAAGRGPGEDKGSNLAMLKQARDRQGWPATHQKLGDRSLTDSPFTALPKDEGKEVMCPHYLEVPYYLTS